MRRMSLQVRWEVDNDKILTKNSGVRIQNSEDKEDEEGIEEGAGE